MSDASAHPLARRRPIRDWPALAARHQALGRGAGLPGDRHRGHRSRRRGAAAASTGSPRAGTARWIIWHGTARPARGPAALVPGTLRVITARMNYRPPAARASDEILDDPAKAFIARYALGRDYHKVMRAQAAAARRAHPRRRSAISATACSPTARRCSKWRWPRRPGIGWRGKHTLLLTREAGSWFFLGEIYTDLPLPVTRAADVALRHLHARASTSARPARSSRRTSSTRGAASRTSRSSFPAAFPRRCGRSSAIASTAATTASSAARGTASRRTRAKPDFARAQRPRRRRPRHAVRVDGSGVRRSRLEGSAIRRIGYERWSRNLAVGLGNAPGDPDDRRGARSARRRPVAARARARRVGARRSSERVRRAEPAGVVTTPRVALTPRELSGSAGSSRRSAASPPARGPARSRPSRRSAPAAAAPRTS